MRSTVYLPRYPNCVTVCGDDLVTLRVLFFCCKNFPFIFIFAMNEKKKTICSFSLKILILNGESYSMVGDILPPPSLKSCQVGQLLIILHQVKNKLKVKVFSVFPDVPRARTRPFHFPFVYFDITKRNLQIPTSSFFFFLKSAS